jgi:hypothetical protein
MTYAGTDEYADLAKARRDEAVTLLDQASVAYTTLGTPTLIAAATAHALLAIEARLADISDNLRVVDGSIEEIARCMP